MVQSSEAIPSDRIWDSEDLTFSKEFKNNLAKKIHDLFCIDVGANKRADESVSRLRQEAFFLCRSTLVSKKINTYGEQFEGMYTLMRGLTAAFGINFFYYLGWAFGINCPNFAQNTILAALIALSIAVAASFIGVKFLEGRKRTLAGYITALGVMASVFAIGALVATRETKAISLTGISWILALSSFLAACQFFGAFKFFAKEFAKAIYRDFYVYEKTASTLQNETGADADKD